MYLKIRNQNIYYQKLGKGPDLVMLHGWGNDVSSFWNISQDLSTDFTLWLIDLPGFGRSDIPKTSFKVKDYAEIIDLFIVKNNLGKPHLLGHSLGGRIAIKLAAFYPNLLDKLILVSSAGIKPKQDTVKFFAYPLVKFIKFFIPNIFNLKTILRHKLYKKLEADYLNAGDLRQTLTNILEEDLTTDLSRIKNDTLIIWGEKDQAVPLKYGKTMYQLIKKSRLEVFDGVGHFPFLEKPDKFVRLVKDFLS